VAHETAHESAHEVLDCLIVGAGPAGLQLGHYLQESARRYLIVEAGDGAGAFFTRFPRHRTLISVNKVHTGWDDPELNLRMDWNSLLSDDPELLFTKYSERYFPAADDYVRYLRDFAERRGLAVRYGTRIRRISRPGGPGPGSGSGSGSENEAAAAAGPRPPFEVTADDGTVFRARTVVAATGLSQPYLPPIPGIETAEPYTEVSVDPEEFTGKRVLILGKGNSAFETADNLVEKAAVIHVAGPHSVQLAWRTHFVGHLRAVNNNFLDTYQLKSQNAVLDGTVQSIDRAPDGGYRVTVSFARADEVTKDIHYDRVIVATGFRFDDSIFAPEVRPELTIKDRFPAQTEEFESVNVPGLRFAGTLTQMRDFKHSTSGFIHGFRYNARALHRILEHREHGVAWPHSTLDTEAYAIADAVLDRVNRTSALWQLFAYLGDLVTIAPDGEVRHWSEVPVDFAERALADGFFGDVASYFTVTLEYGKDHALVDPFDVTAARIAQTDAENAPDGRYLHPVVRHVRDGVCLAEHHVTENLENEWDSPEVHRAPLVDFLAGALAEELS